MHTQDTPTPREELERKVIDLMTAQAHLVDQGRVNVADLAYLGRSLWTVTAGLVDDSVGNLLTAAGMSAPARPNKRSFYHPAKGRVPRGKGGL